MTERNEARLPGWAQDRLAQLRRELASAQEQVAAVYGTPPEDAQVTLGSTLAKGHLAVPRFYRPIVRVPMKGRLGEKFGNPTVPLEVDVDEEALILRAGGSHSPSIVIVPVVSNVVRIEARRDV